MLKLNLEAEYETRSRISGVVDISMRWSTASAAARAQLRGERDVPYGPGPRQMYDLFRTDAASAPAPLVLFIHGGQWCRGDRKEYAFVATPLVAAGLDVAIPSYSLCPQASLKSIIAELRVCAAELWRRSGRRPLVVGHDAGAHLAAALVATDWSHWPGVPDVVVPAGYGISGIYDLEPLTATSIGAPLRLSATDMRQVSPIHWPAPAGRRFVAAVGGDETQEYMRQSLDLALLWSRADVKAECVVIPGANHLTILDEICRPLSAAFDRIVSLAKAIE